MLLSLEIVRLDEDDVPFIMKEPPLSGFLIVVVVFIVFVIYFLGEFEGDLLPSKKSRLEVKPLVG